MVETRNLLLLGIIPNDNKCLFALVENDSIHEETEILSC